MKVTALIMAGGQGMRFWPKSRKNLPKQFLSLTDDGRTMIELTVERIMDIVGIEDVFVATNSDYMKIVEKQLPHLPKENILCEPAPKNTAPCIGLAAAHIEKKHGDAVMLVLPSDHLIKNNALFLQAIRDAIEVAASGENLVTIGITPSTPETGYGYIKFNGQKKEGNAFSVEQFIEKPNFNLAKKYVSSGEYLWNSGMFVWKASTILAQTKENLADTYSGLMKIQNAIGSDEYNKILEKTFKSFASESVDYAIMEKAKNIFTVPGAFWWNDVGSWLALTKLNNSDESDSIIEGNVVAVDCKNNIIQGGKKLIALAGVRDIVVVDTDDAILICSKDSTQDGIKRILENLKNSGREKYL